jgi:hypothetical protein
MLVAQTTGASVPHASADVSFRSAVEGTRSSAARFGEQHDVEESDELGQRQGFLQMGGEI